MTSIWVHCVILGALLSGSGLGRAPEPSLWRFVHPGAKALAGIQWSQVQETELGRWIQHRWIDGLAIPGSEFLKDVDEVLISSPGIAHNNDQEDPPLLIAIRGRFNIPRVEEVLLRHGATKQIFGQIAIWRPQAGTNADPAFAIVDSGTILAGDIRSLFSTLERSRFESLEKPAEQFLERARVLAERYDCWAIMRDNSTMQGFLLSSLTGDALTPNSQGFEAGIRVRDGLELEIKLKASSAIAARALQSKLTRAVRMVALQKTGGFAALLNKLQITADASNVLLTLRVPQAEAARNLNPIQPVAPAPRSNLTIKIDGLDDGPREVPFNQ